MGHEQMVKFWWRLMDPDRNPNCDTGKTCLGGDMPCPRALEVFTIMPYINLHFIYLLTYLLVVLKMLTKYG